MPLALYDTWSRTVRAFEPIHAGYVGMYCYGPTVYDHVHIGNLRTSVFEAILRRTLMRNGYDVRHVVNITDVGHLVSDADEGEDKMENGSRQDDYGCLARLDRAGLQAGKRVALGAKRSITDFALWKFSPAGVKRQMEWDSPWGRGFPGWHIECSAMSAKYLGTWFDIHCGGEDHIAVHHSNEIAQTEAAHGTRLANFWLHGHFLTLDAAKMSKSGGTFIRLETLRERNVDPPAYRYLCATAHYRSKLHFSWARPPYQAAGGAPSGIPVHSDTQYQPGPHCCRFARSCRTAAAYRLNYRTIGHSPPRAAPPPGFPPWHISSSRLRSSDIS